VFDLLKKEGIEAIAQKYPVVLQVKVRGRVKGFAKGKEGKEENYSTGGGEGVEGGQRGKDSTRWRGE
jgi:hypothetical protein